VTGAIITAALSLVNAGLAYWMFLSESYAVAGCAIFTAGFCLALALVIWDKNL
jgi:hypothetical protein